MTSPTHTLTTKRRKVADLRPHPLNARNGDVDAIIESLRVNGQYRPIVTTTDGTVLAGNHTYFAAAELGWVDVACVTLDLDPMSDEAKRIMLADNRTSDLGKYDDGLLADLLTGLPDLDGTGYDQAALDKLLADHDVLGDIGGDTDEQMGKASYAVIIDARDQAHQADLLNRLEAEGLTCRPLML